MNINKQGSTCISSLSLRWRVFIRKVFLSLVVIVFSPIGLASADSDFGDAPESFGDASHTIVSGLHLGETAPDAEAGSQHTHNAYGDGDAQSSDSGTWYMSGDEDGAPRQPVSDYIPLFPLLKMTAMTYSADFVVTNTLGKNANLFAWIDFDGNGSFDADEAASSVVADGSSEASVTVNWNVPVDVKLGTTFIRLRLTSDASVTSATPTGAASDGEVEDFALAVAMDIPPDSDAVTVISGETPLVCQSVVFADDFDDVSANGAVFLAPNRGAGGGDITTLRDWTVAGGGADTYARIVDVSNLDIDGGIDMGIAVYLGNGAVRRISPAIGSGFTFDAEGRVTNTIDAIELRDAADDSSPDSTLMGLGTAAHWGPEPVTLTRSFTTETGKTYRVYFKAIPEGPGGDFGSGAMRIDVPGGSVHFKIPGGNEGIIDYAIEFTATGTDSTISFVNYGHVNSRSGLGWCDPASEYVNNPWCTVGGGDAAGNELIIDEVVVAESNCGSGSISGVVYKDVNNNDNHDSAVEEGIGSITLTLFDDNGTSADVNDDVQVATISSNADGTYQFSPVNAGLTYRLEVDANDADLPVKHQIGTENPLINLSVANGAELSNQNFGFDPILVSCPAGYAPKIESGFASVITEQQGVGYVQKVLGALAVENAAPDSSVAALLATDDSMILDLGQLVPESSDLIISLARNGEQGKVEIATSADNSSYHVHGTFGEGGALGEGNTLELKHLALPAPAGGVRYVRFISQTASVWVDGVAYNAICIGAGDIKGTVYRDSNGNDSLDALNEDGIGSIGVTLRDEEDNSVIATVDTISDGTYIFPNVRADKTYRIEVNTSDADLPAGAVPGTVNPLTAVTVTAETILTDQDFGFDVTTPAVYTTIGEYRFDDCAGDGSWNKDSSGKNNPVAGSAAVVTDDFKAYGCTSVQNSSWNMEIPHIADYEVDSGAVSILLYDHHNVWSDTLLLEKGLSDDKKLSITATQVGDSLSGTISASINGNTISTGEVYYTTRDDGADDDTQWKHVMLTFGVNGMKLYINGELKGNNAYTGGISEVPGNFSLPKVSGYFDEVYILDGQPNAQQVKSIYDNLVDNKNLDGSQRACACKVMYTNNYCVAPDDVTGLLELGDMPTSAVNGGGNYSYPDRVLPGYGTVDVTVAMVGGGLHNASASAIDTGQRLPAWTNEGLPFLGLAVYLEPPANGSATVTYDFDQPTGNVDLLLLDLDFEDAVKITARDGKGNPITDFSGWRYRSGDLSVWQDPDPEDALPPAWDSSTAVMSSTDTGNDHRSFGLLTPDTLVTEIVVRFDVPAVSGRHVYTSLHTTLTGRDGESCAMGTVSGVVYTDLDGNDQYDAATEPGLSAIKVSLYDEMGTSANYADDTLVATANSAVDGSYSFSISSGPTFRVQVDAGDTDLPAGALPGTKNPVIGVVPKTGTDPLIPVNFGFDSPQTAFTCDASIYISSSESEATPAQFYSVDTGSSPFTLNAIGDTAHDRSYNAMGYREQDNYIYAIEQSGNNVLRIGADGSIANLGSVTGLPAPSNIFQTYDAGDVFPDGYLYVHQVTSHPELYKIDVTTNPPTLVETITLGQSIWLSDFAYNKVDDKVYGIGDQGEKFMIDPADWSVSTVGGGAPAASYGAAYTDNAGNVYIYKNNPGTFYQVDFGLNGTGTGSMQEISTAPNIAFYDGASCRNASPVQSCSMKVTTTSDSNSAKNNSGSLRDAIECANENPGLDTISFAIPDSESGYVDPDGTSGNSDDYWSIKPNTALPDITDPVIIAGNTQPGYSNKPIIEIDGSNAGSVEGLYFSNGSDGSTLRGLIINRFRLSAVELRNSGSHTVIGNFIGTDSTGLLDRGNDDHGVEIADGSGSNTIGGTGVLDGNIISANHDSAIRIDGFGSNLIQGNTMGLGRDGVTPLSNLNHGLYIRAPGNTVGGSLAAARNVIAESGYNGIELFEVTDNIVQGNYIGIDRSGTLKRPNRNYGINVSGGSANTIGGSADGVRNLISGNTLDGIMLDGTSKNKVQGNYIGTTVDGNTALGNAGIGITLRDSQDNEIGGLSAGAGNLISGNADRGIWVRDPSTTGNKFQGNQIGVSADKSAPVANGSNGIEILEAAENLVENNIIAYNSGNGIALRYNTSIKNTLSRNQTYANSGLGIDLDNDGITLNDENDSDTGPNQLLNHPILSKVVSNGIDLKVSGCAPTGAVLELFEADVSAGGAAIVGANRFGLSDDYGEGQTYLASFVEGSLADSDDASCSFPGINGNNHNGMSAFYFSIPLPGQVVVNDLLTATATLNSSGTSEFSPVVKTNDLPPGIGGGTCTSAGGTDILFIVDNSGSITTDEYADFSQTIQSVGAGFLADNPTNRLAIAHFGGPSDSLVSGGQYVYVERDFSTDPMTAPVRQFGTGGAYNASWYADHLAGAIEQMRYIMDANPTTTTNLVVSPIKEMSRDLSIPLQIVLMTDAARYADNTPGDITMLIDPPGSGAEPDDGSPFTIYNQLKDEDVSFSVVSFNPYPTDIEASAAIASVGGTYTGAVEANSADPEGSQTTPRRYVSVTSGFQLSAEQLGDVIDTVAICGKSITGTIFEDLNYGGGQGRAFGTAGTVALANANIEVYDATGAYVAAVTSDDDGLYRLPNMPDGEYFVRVLNESVTSSRAGSNGSEIPVMTYRSDGVNAVTNEVGGRYPALADASANSGTSKLDTMTFKFVGGSLDTLPAQAIQPVTLAGETIKGANFGFNFSTVVNTNAEGQGSLPQFILNNNLLSSAEVHQQLPALVSADYSKGDNVAVFMIPTNQLTEGEAIINPSTELRLEQARTVIDGRVQVANMNSGTIVLKGDGTTLVNGVYFDEHADSSVLRHISVKDYAGSGIVIYGTGSSSNNGAVIDNVSITNNLRYGILIQNDASHTRLVANSIHNNHWAGISSESGSDNTFSANSISNHGTADSNALGIDLGADGVTSNSNTDVWPNYPEVAAGSTIGSNGSQVVTYDFDLEVPENTYGYRLEFFGNTEVDPSGHGEGNTYLGFTDISHPGTGLENFKGLFNANQSVPADAKISVTLTEKLGVSTLGATSEFSGVRGGNTAVCTDLLSDPDALLENVTVDENSGPLTLLEAVDENGDPITYVISGGADGRQFVIKKVPGALFDCFTIEFIVEDDVIGTKNLSAVSTTKAAPPGIAPTTQAAGNYEAPTDSGADNNYELVITATDVDGNQVTKPVTISIQNVNEKPRITTSSSVSFVERQDSASIVLDLESHDPDADDAEGSGLSYSISGGPDSRQFTVDPYTGEMRFVTTPDFGSPADKDGDNRYEITVRVADDQGYASSKDMIITVVDDPESNGVSLRVKALLQGAYDTDTGLMRDSLRSKGILPVKQPYNREPFNYEGNEQINLNLVETEGEHAVVDWVLLELRSAADLTSVVAGKAALITRNGEIIDAETGEANLSFMQAQGGQYYLSLRHRNHLGVMSDQVLALGLDAVMMDFTLLETVVKGEHARLPDAANEVALLWCGDVDQDQRLVLSGAGSDLNPLFSKVLTAEENTVFNSSYQVRGYQDTDLNMDGVTLFIGPDNDANVLLGNILLHPANEDFAGNFVVNGGL